MPELGPPPLPPWAEAPPDPDDEDPFDPHPPIATRNEIAAATSTGLGAAMDVDDIEDEIPRSPFIKFFLPNNLARSRWRQGARRAG